MHLLTIIHICYVMYKVVICLVTLLFVKKVFFYGIDMPIKLMAVVGYEPTPFRTCGFHCHLKHLLPGLLDAQPRRYTVYSLPGPFRYDACCSSRCVFTYRPLRWVSLLIIISNLSNDRSKASCKTVPPHSAI